MTDRRARAKGFLDRTGWAGAKISPLAGDASNRRYERLRNPETGQTAVLMDAPPEKGEDIRPFVRIARHLHGLGLSAPEIFAEDPENGFLILEDLGDELFSRVLSRRPDLETGLYTEAVHVLVSLRHAPLPVLAEYDPPLMAELACLAFSKYRDPATGGSSGAIQAKFSAIFEHILGEHASGEKALAQRDYHADNLLWLPDRKGAARVGLLDFQDAMAGHPAYDLVSLLQDVRRDVKDETESAMIRYYISETGADDKKFRNAYAVLGAQRSLRILGVFGRLGLEYGKPHYVDMIPKVWAILMRNLEHPALKPVAGLLTSELPEPNADILSGLKPA